MICKECGIPMIATARKKPFEPMWTTTCIDERPLEVDAEYTEYKCPRCLNIEVVKIDSLKKEEDKMTRTTCPLTTDGFCAGKDCAWWFVERNCCAVTGIAKLADLVFEHGIKMKDGEK